MKWDEIQLNTWLKFFSTVCLWLALAASLHAAGAQSSAHYMITAESIDGGGLRAASAAYTGDGGFIGVGDFTTSTNYVQRGGYIGQLNNPPVAADYTVTVFTNGTAKVPIRTLLRKVKDADGDPVSFISVAGTSAQNGVVGQVGVRVFYKPPAGFSGSDSFTWVVQDSEGDQATGTILVQVSSDPVTPGQPILNLISITFNPTPGATDAALSFASQPEATYVVQYTDDMVSPVTWTTLGTVAATTDGAFQIVDPTARNASQRYYRAIIQP